MMVVMGDHSLNHHPLYLSSTSLKCHHTWSADPLAHGVWPQHLSHIFDALRSLAIGDIFVLVFVLVITHDCIMTHTHSYLSLTPVFPLCSIYILFAPAHLMTHHNS